MTIDDSGEMEQNSIFSKLVLVNFFWFDEFPDFSSGRLVEIVEGLLDVSVSDPEAAEEATIFLGTGPLSLAVRPLSQGADCFVFPVVAVVFRPEYTEFTITGLIDLPESKKLL